MKSTLPNNTSLPGDYADASDNELVRLSLKDVDSFYYLMKRYETILAGYIRKMANVRQEEVEDILQEIFIKVYRNLNGFNQELKFSSWIYRIAHNEMINQFRKRRFHEAMVSLDDEFGDATIYSSLLREKNLHEQYASHETATMVRKALAGLPIKYREVIVLYYLEGKDYREISDILRKPPGTVATLLTRAKAKLRKMAKYYHLEGTKRQ